MLILWGGTLMEELGISLRETLLKSDLPKAILELGEIGLDSFLDAGVFKDVPVFGQILAVGNVFGSVRDYLFARRLMRFLKSFSTLTVEERGSLINRLDSDAEFGKYTGERLIDLLSRLDDEQKPELVAKAFKLYAKGEITAEQLLRLQQAIERVLFYDLARLGEFCKPGGVFSVTDGNPIAAGFINAGLGYVRSGYGAGGIEPTETAWHLLAILGSEQDNGLSR